MKENRFFVCGTFRVNRVTLLFVWLCDVCRQSCYALFTLLQLCAKRSTIVLEKETYE